jgi:exonuclease SbcD
MPTRLIHTSDWHLGHVLHDVDQSPEQQAFLHWLADLCVSEKAHGLLIAGDLYDVSNPPASAVGMLAKFLVGLWKRLPNLTVVAIGGNHDSAYRLETTEPYLRALGRLHVLGAVPRREGAIDLGRALVRVEGDGDSALVAAVPFLRASDLRAEDLAGAADGPVRRVHDELFAGARAALREREALVAMGHLFVAGGTQGGSERPLVGGVDAVPPDLFPPEVVYAALGHLHRAQTMAGRLSYSGAPVALSFDEVAYRRQVRVVELESGALKAVREVEVPVTRELHRLPATGSAPLADVLAALRALPPARKVPDNLMPLVEVSIRLERPEPSLRMQLEEALEGRAGRLVKWRTEYSGSGAALADAAGGKGLGDLDPLEVFRGRWASRHEGEPPADLAAAFASLLEEARGEVIPTVAAPEVES